jgi:3-deoxy-D-manno-octulosonic acid kinase
MKIPHGYSIHKEKNTTIIFKDERKDLLKTIPLEGQIGKPSLLKGRNEIHILNDIVVRNLTHGGMLRGITKDRFLSPERSICELAVSAHLLSRGIPTPEILAIRCVRIGLFIYISVLSKLVPDSIDLMTYLTTKRTEAGDLFEKTGKLARKMHDSGVFHADFHIKNILLDATLTPWILDLDKAKKLEFMPYTLKWLNIKRFFRSCRKWAKKEKIMLPDNWQKKFMEGYLEK